MFSEGFRLEPSFVHSLVKMEPEASQVKLTLVPSTGTGVDDLTEASDIFFRTEMTEG